MVTNYVYRNKHQKSQYMELLTQQAALQCTNWNLFQLSSAAESFGYHSFQKEVLTKGDQYGSKNSEYDPPTCRIWERLGENLDPGGT